MVILPGPLWLGNPVPMVIPSPEPRRAWLLRELPGVRSVDSPSMLAGVWALILATRTATTQYVQQYVRTMCRTNLLSQDNGNGIPSGLFCEATSVQASLWQLCTRRSCGTRQAASHSDPMRQLPAPRIAGAGPRRPQSAKEETTQVPSSASATKEV